jgi:hypothetical protein
MQKNEPLLLSPPSFIHASVLVTIFSTIACLEVLVQQYLDLVSICLLPCSRDKILTGQSRPYWLPSLVDQDTGIVVELDNHPILPLQLLCRSHNDSMPYISSFDLVGSGSRGGCAASTGSFSKVPLFLHHDYYSIT